MLMARVCIGCDDADEGFSLVEVIVAMLILSAAASIVVANVRRSVDSVKDEVVFQQVETTLSIARAKSVEIMQGVSLNEVHSSLFEERPRRVFFEAPDTVLYPGLCPETKAIVSFRGKSQKFSIGFGTCHVQALGTETDRATGFVPRS